MYKYNEFTDEEFKHFNQYGGTFTYIAELPQGTTFSVANGGWDGKVIHKEDGIYLQTTHDDKLCLNGENQFKIDHTYYLWLTNINKTQ